MSRILWLVLMVSALAIGSFNWRNYALQNHDKIAVAFSCNDRNCIDFGVYYQVGQAYFEISDEAYDVTLFYVSPNGAYIALYETSSNGPRLRVIYANTGKDLFIESGLFPSHWSPTASAIFWVRSQDDTLTKLMVNPDKGRTGYTGEMKHRKFRLSEDEIRAIEGRERDTREALELRRLQGVRLYGSGIDMRVVEQVSGAARRTVADWVKAYQEKGIAGLKPGWKGGNHRKLSAEKRVECRQRLQQMTPEQALSGQTDLPTDGVWSVATLAVAVERWYGVRYRSSESYRLLLIEAGLSFQQPEGIYRSRPSDTVIADFEAAAEKK